MILAIDWGKQKAPVAAGRVSFLSEISIQFQIEMEPPIGKTDSPHPTKEDLADIRSSLEGDEKAFARIVRRYQQQVSQQMWRFTRDPTELEELVQEVFIEVYQSLGSFKGQAPLVHWMRKIASRVGFRFWKKQYRAKALNRTLAGQSNLTWAAAEELTPGEAEDVLFKLFGHLKVKERLLLTLHYFEGCDARQIAERMNWNMNLVRVRLHRTLKKLRSLVLKMGYECRK